MINLTDRPTNWIAFNASSNSDWDSCQFALLKLDKSGNEQILNRLKLVKNLSKEYSFYNVQFWGSPNYWCVNTGEDEHIVEYLYKNDWSFVEIENEENIKIPEQRTDCEIMCITKDSINFTARGKHTSEDFWTCDLPMKKIIKQWEMIYK